MSNSLDQPPQEGSAASAPLTHRIDNFWNALRALPKEQWRELARELMTATIAPEEYLHIPSLVERANPFLNTWRMQNERMSWDIPLGARVLDVGSGGWPFSRATHLGDRFTGSTTHRFEQLARDERPLTVFDVERLPFADQAFEFVFCSHVVEHLDDPGRALRELQRVGRAGYVEVPTRLSDVMFNFTRLESHHRWHGLNLNGTLALIEWPHAERRDLGSNHFFQLTTSSYESPFQQFLENNWDLFFAGIRWQGKLPFIVLSNTGKVLDQLA